MPKQATTIPLLLQLLSPGAPSAETLTLLPGEQDYAAWQDLISEADRLDAQPQLYLRLKALGADQTCPAEVWSGLRQVYLSTASRNTLILHCASDVLRALVAAGVPVIGLKGIYLLENLYGDIGARGMNDIDLLVHKQDLGLSMRTLEALGYQPVSYFDLNNPNIEIKHIPPMARRGSPAVEVHWTLQEEDSPFNVDVDGLWERAKPARMADTDALALSAEDLIAHLCLHLTYQHYLKLGLRGLHDIALILHARKDEMNWPELARISRSWGVERIVALTLTLASDLLVIALPTPALVAFPEGLVPRELLTDAQSQLLGRQPYQDYFTPDLVELTEKNGVFGKARLALSRLFLPRRTLARIYGVPPNSIRIVGCYFRRFAHLWRQYGKTLRKIGSGDETLTPALEDGKVAEALHRWMSG